MCAERVVFITGGIFTEDLREFAQENEHRILEKPFLLEDLIKTIKKIDVIFWAYKATT